MSDELKNMDKEFEIFCDTKENCPKSIGMGCNVFHTANCKVKFLKSKIAELEKYKQLVKDKVEIMLKDFRNSKMTIPMVICELAEILKLMENQNE